MDWFLYDNGLRHEKVKFGIDNIPFGNHDCLICIGCLSCKKTLLKLDSL